VKLSRKKGRWGRNKNDWGCYEGKPWIDFTKKKEKKTAREKEPRELSGGETDQT